MIARLLRLYHERQAERCRRRWAEFSQKAAKHQNARDRWWMREIVAEAARR